MVLDACSAKGRPLCLKILLVFFACVNVCVYVDIALSRCLVGFSWCRLVVSLAWLGVNGRLCRCSLSPIYRSNFQEGKGFGWLEKRACLAIVASADGEDISNWRSIAWLVDGSWYLLCIQVET